MRTRASLLSALLLCLAACGGAGDEPDASAHREDGGSSEDGGAVDAGGRDASAFDAGGRDASVFDEDAGLADAGMEDAGLADAGLADAGADAGPPDAGPMAPLACDTTSPCPFGECLAGLCFERATTSSSIEGMNRLERMVAGVDRDGTLRLLTGVGTSAWEVTGTPGALSVTTLNTASDRDPFFATGRQGTDRAHHGYTLAAYRWAVIDGVSTIREDRVITGHHHSFAPDGSLVVYTLPQIPESVGTGFRSPLRLWTHDGSTWSFEDITRDVGSARPHIVRFDRAGGIELLRAYAFHLHRWRLDLVAGWTTELVHTFDTAMTAAPAWVNDARGHTHAVVTLDNSGVDDDRIVYVEIDRDGNVARELLVQRRDPIFTVVRSSVERDDEGNVWFLSYGPISTSRRTSYLHRVGPDDRVETTPLSSLRADTPPEWQALAVAPDSTLHVLTYRSTAPTEILTLTPLR